MGQIYRHTFPLDFTKSPNPFTKPGLRVFGFCPAGSTIAGLEIKGGMWAFFEA